MNSLDITRSTPATTDLLISSVDLIPNPASESPIAVIDYDGFETLLAVMKAERDIGVIAASVGPLFTLQNIRRSGALVPSVHPTRCGSRFLRLLLSSANTIPSRFPSHSFPQELTQLADIAERYQISGLSAVDLVGANAIHWCSQLNAAIDQLRLSAKDLSDKRLRSTKASRKNLYGGLRWLDRILAKRKRLCVIRVDLHTAKPYEWGAPNMHALSVEEMFAQRAEFVRRLSSTPALKGGPLGYMIKSEFTLRRSLHHHVLLVLDGNVHQQHIKLAKAVGEFWVNQVTHGMGTYQNINLHTDLDSLDCGIGMVSVHDQAKVLALKRNVIGYLCKPDYLARLVIPRRHRLFLKSVAVPLRGPKRGRPRKQHADADELSTFDTPLPSPVLTACNTSIVMEN